MKPSCSQQADLTIAVWGRPSPVGPTRRREEDGPVIRNRIARRDAIAGYLFLVPWLAGFFLLTAGPMVASLLLAFTNYNLFASPSWVGLANFERMLGDPQFWTAWRVTLGYVVVAAPLKLATALAVALMLNGITKASGFYRSVFYAPSLVGASVSIAIVWRALFMDGSAVDLLGQILGFPAGGWVGQPAKTLPMLVLLAMWQFGAPMVIFLAGLKQIPREFYEAAAVDGAGRTHAFWSITLPLLTPVLFFNLLLETINAFQVFGSAFIISNGTGGPAQSSLFYTIYLYFRGFQDFQMGYASALAWVFVLVIGLITLVVFRTSDRWVFYTAEQK